MNKAEFNNHAEASKTELLALHRELLSIAHGNNYLPALDITMVSRICVAVLDAAMIIDAAIRERTHPTP